ncbi:hypothetical protein [Zhihengliuella halotolerans]|uniref:Uncharacterized protein n=1 Tax=Zhihengliuella halotolerans TaxID=370736 RepID=A0A4Q8AEE2_9MICC|nr:hypothetical protein [Zhihengliuella halotolerans]RZU62171.1 hypothetical protein EV380_1761 [Zhihengliuella halotolerans]
MGLPRVNKLHTRPTSLEEQFAPHVETKWAGDMILELRLRGVDGTRIGDALAEVNSHCAESGERPEDTFGDPVTYARSLKLPSVEDTAIVMVRVVAPVLVQILGMLLLLWSFTDWRRGSLFNLTSGEALIAATLTVEVIAVALLAQPVLRFLVRHPVLTFGALVLNMGLFVFAAAIWDNVVAEFPPMWALTLGAAAMLGGLMWGFFGRTGLNSPDDPIESPLSGPLPNAAAGDTKRRLRRSPWETFLPLMIPIATALQLAMGWLLIR